MTSILKMIFNRWKILQRFRPIKISHFMSCFLIIRDSYLCWISSFISIEVGYKHSYVVITKYLSSFSDAFVKPPPLMYHNDGMHFGFQSRIFCKIPLNNRIRLNFEISEACLNNSRVQMIEVESKFSDRSVN